ncbi:MAG: glycosyltransferase family 39 protein [Candidatus Schekmanbacteria bacterium]|nr:glycosyltransferase family 39 protein [Candidatus Schekmanbacteria bacterium]
MKYLTALLIFFLSLTLLYTSTDSIGITCDEAWLNDTAAKSFASWMKFSLVSVSGGAFSSFRSRGIVEKYFGEHLHYHPPFGRMIHAISWGLFKNIIGDIKSLRLSPEIMFSITCALIFLLALRITDIPSALIASLGLLFMPRMFGQAHIFALDIPITFMWVLTIYFFITGIEKKYFSVLFAITLGLALCTKAHALMIPVALLVWIIFYPDKKAAKFILYGALISPFVFYLSNPWLWVDFWPHLAGFFEGMSTHTNDFIVKTFYLGNTYDSNKVPWHYAPLITLLTIPAPLVILIVAGAGTSIYYLLKRVNWKRIDKKTDAEKFSVLFLINAILPIAAIATGIGPAYDGERLFLPSFPFLAILSGVGFYNLKNFFLKGRYKFLASIAGAVIIISSAISLYNIHPYELSYYNAFAGGLKGAQKLGLESTYWGDPFNKDVLNFLNTKLKRCRIANRCGFYSIPFDYYHKYEMLSPDVVYDQNDYEYLIINFREGFFDQEIKFYTENITPIFSAGPGGIPLIAIYRNIEKGSPSELFKNVDWGGEWLKTGTSFYDESGTPLPEQHISFTEYPFINNVYPGNAKLTTASIKAIFKAESSGTYRYKVYSTGKFSISIDSKKIFREELPSNYYEVKSFHIEKGYHNVEITFVPNSKEKRFFAVIASPSY